MFTFYRIRRTGASRDAVIAENICQDSVVPRSVSCANEAAYLPVVVKVEVGFVMLSEDSRI